MTHEPATCPHRAPRPRAAAARAIARAGALAGIAAGCVVGDAARQELATHLVAIDPDTPLEPVFARIGELGAEVDQVWPTLHILRIVAGAGAAARLANDPRILAMTPVERVADKARGTRQAVARAAPGTQVVPWGVERVGGAAPASAAMLWILDSGIDLEHPDLAIDAGRSRDLVVDLGIGDEGDEPDTWHGTAVAGVAAALDNGRDAIGVAPGARVASVRVLDGDGVGHSDVIVAGLEHVARHAARGDVINLSLAAPGENRVLELAVARLASQGVAVVIAAGNAAADAGGYTPARIRHPGVHTVSAVGQDDCLAAFSNHGSTIAFAAPGADVVTLRPGGGLAVVDGTSFAAPHVAGLLLSGGVGSDGVTCEDEGPGEPIAHRRP
jgi:hypothetical protein